ncbi:ABC transporter substrate-binding protein [Massilia sp. CF038]|uniref:substrate-binding periplasmic protein n=1 Tax=Massilia sp. CF038 TaxID=1881045 RepID=UPI00091AA276|nr:transporter substrate-binding domain-containing protein [Massilia sp. CF038]SHH51642.1 amino acid ABC transporter substrate-binding protein, PAAT family [Massilia sp. CF038]
MVKQIVVVAALLAWQAAAAAVPLSAPPAPLYITTEYSPPTSMQEGERVIGSATDKIREALARTGIAYSIELLPWKRAYAAALNRSDSCVYSTTRTPEREGLFKWVGPTDEGEWVLLGRADRQYKLETLEDARKLRIGTYNGDARDEYLRARGFKVDPAPNDMINPRKLMMNRIDLWAAGIRRGSAVLEVNGWADTIVPVLTFNRVKLYLACNRGVPDSTITRLNEALDAMLRDGTWRKLDHKYDTWVETKAGAVR